MSELPGLYNDFIAIFLMMAGFYLVVSRANLIRKVIGLNIFQTAVIMMYISFGKITGATAPIILPSGGEHGGGEASHVVYSNPIPHVLMLTAIVVGVATLALGLSLVVRINEAYGTVDEDEINRKDNGL